MQSVINLKTHRMRNTSLIALSIAVTVELLLRMNVARAMKLESWLLLPTKDRGAFPTKYSDIVPFIKVNREGAFSCIGLTSLHFFGRFFWRICTYEKEQRRIASRAMARFCALDSDVYLNGYPRNYQTISSFM